MTDANLVHADLSGVNFCGVGLTQILTSSGTSFDGAALAAARMDKVNPGGADLSGAKLARQISDLEVDTRDTLQLHTKWT